MTTRLLRGKTDTIHITETLICEGLGYCCPSFFFLYFPSPTLNAARLGLTIDTTKRWKLKARTGECTCTGSPNCMKRLLKLHP